MKVALLQYAVSEDKPANIAKALRMCEKAIARGAQFILLPEIGTFRGDIRNKELFAKAVEKIPGPTSNVFARVAQHHKISILLGSIMEKADATHAYNSSVFIDPRGRLVKYRKIHLFHACLGDKIIREQDCFRAGRQPKTAVVGEFKMGLSVCYDLRFSDLYQKYARQGVDVLTIPSCFTRKTGEAHWETLLRARAIEGLSYVLAPNQVGSDARGIQSHGHSMIISPWGKVIARGSPDKEEIIFGTIEREEIRKARKILPGIIKSY